MRVDAKDVDIIKTTLISKISDAKIFLFGSRVDEVFCTDLWSISKL